MAGLLEKDKGEVIDFEEIMFGDIFAQKTQSPFFELEDGLSRSLASNTGVLFRYLEYTVAITKTSDGILLFDPHARNDSGFVDGDGVAQLISFPSVPKIVQHFRKFVKCNGIEDAVSLAVENIPMAQRSFEILPVSLISLKVSLHRTKYKPR